MTTRGEKLMKWVTNFIKSFLFQSSGSTGRVFFFKKGICKDMGLAYSGLIGPTTTVAVVPTTLQIVQFAIPCKTQDKQNVTVKGCITVTFIPETAVSKFNFTVDSENGGYIGDWVQILNAMVTEHVTRAVHKYVKDFDVEEAVHLNKENVENGVTSALGGIFTNDGIVVHSCSIPEIRPSDSDIVTAIGSKQRQEILTDSDAALHERQMKAAIAERELKQYELSTKHELEAQKAALIQAEAVNIKAQAEATAAAIKIRISSLAGVPSSRLLAMGLMEASENGNLNNLTITTEFLQLLKNE